MHDAGGYFLSYYTYMQKLMCERLVDIRISLNMLYEAGFGGLKLHES